MVSKEVTSTRILSVLVSRVRHTSDGFSVYNAELIDDNDPLNFTSYTEIVVKQFVGPVSRGQRWTVAGRVKIDEKWGQQFEAQFATLGVPRNLHELDAMLSSGMLDGWDINSSDRVIGTFPQDQVVDIVVRDHQRLGNCHWVTEHMIESLAEALRRAGAMAQIYAQLGEWEVKGKLADKLVKHYQYATIERLAADPYADIIAIDGYGWQSADSLGNRVGILANDPRRLKAGITVAVYDATWQAGHTWLTEFEACRAAERLLGVGYETVEQELGAAIASGNLVLDSGRLYPAALHRAEDVIADQVCMRIQQSTPQLPLPVGAGWDHDGLSGQQSGAVVMGLCGRVSLLTGGPGVGKTTTLRTLVRVARQQGLQPTCLAPTGKAAARMAEATGWPASTIHSKLKITPGQLDLDREVEQLSGLVIVDEVSMLDTTLAAQLLSRLAPSAQLLLVGDPDQLPSVGPGAVLRDLLDADILPRVHLDKVYRNDAGIAVNAARIRAGESIMEMDDVSLIEADSPAHAAQLTQALLVDLQRQGMSSNDILVLTPTNDGPSGRYTLNRELQPLLNSAQPGSGITQYLGSGSDPSGDGTRRSEELRLGDRVMITKNNSELGVFNGQVGTVVGMSQPKSLEVDIDGRRIRFAGEDKRSVTLAYAITGHKSQGSEAKVVIAPIFPSRVLSREWLYTVLTRARERAYLIGNVDAMQSCLAIRRANERHTGLVSRIHARLAAVESTV